MASKGGLYFLCNQTHFYQLLSSKKPLIQADDTLTYLSTGYSKVNMPRSSRGQRFTTRRAASEKDGLKRKEQAYQQVSTEDSTDRLDNFPQKPCFDNHSRAKKKKHEGGNAPYFLRASAELCQINLKPAWTVKQQTGKRGHNLFSLGNHRCHH